MNQYVGIVTRDLTESACLAVEAGDVQEAMDAMIELARSEDGAALFALDDPSMHRPYFGDPDGVEAVAEEEFLAVRREMERRLGGEGADEPTQRARLLIGLLARRLTQARARLLAGDGAQALEALFGDGGLDDLEGLTTARLGALAASRGVSRWDWLRGWD